MKTTIKTVLHLVWKICRHAVFLILTLVITTTIVFTLCGEILFTDKLTLFDKAANTLEYLAEKLDVEII